MKRRNRQRSRAQELCGFHPGSGSVPTEAEFEQRLKVYLAEQVHPQVEEYGFAIQYIATDDHRQDFHYTIGLNGLGFPELLLVGYHPVLASIILEMLVSEVREKYEPEQVRDRTRVYLPIGPDEAAVAFWLLAPTPEQDRDRGPGMAKAYYQQWVPHLVVKPAGWPCERCTSEYDQRARCTCKFSCSWTLCRLHDGTGVPLPPVASAALTHTEETHDH